MARCASCEGRGEKRPGEICHACKGTGKAKEPERYDGGERARTQRQIRKYERKR